MLICHVINSLNRGGAETHLFDLITEQIKNNENILSFTPIKLEEFYKENYLFPPKSTWITPRI